MADTLLLGAVAYDMKVVRIWTGFRAWFRAHDLDLDFVLYSHYERQVEDLVAGRIQLAWNSPLAWIRASRAAHAVGATTRPLVMRDTDQDLRSVVVVRAHSPVTGLTGLAGCTVATGAVDSPQATLIPLAHIAESGIEVKPQRYDIGIGLHGDHVGGERDAARALAHGSVDAAVMLDANHLLFATDGTLAPGGTRVIARTPPYDHCNLTVTDRSPREPVERLRALLLGMSYGDPELRWLFDLEGLSEWRPGRVTGYAALDDAVDRAGFYDDVGRVTMPGYCP